MVKRRETFQKEKFVEQLKDLLFDAKISVPELANKIGVSKVAIYRYIELTRTPTMEILIKIAEYFLITLDYLIGSEPESYTSNFLKVVPFNERFALLIKRHKVIKYQLCKETEIDEESVYAWLKGKNKPTIDSVIQLAKYFKSSVDYVVGRVDYN